MIPDAGSGVEGKTANKCCHYTLPHHTLEFNSCRSFGKGKKPELEGKLIIEGDKLIAVYKRFLPNSK